MSQLNQPLIGNDLHSESINMESSNINNSQQIINSHQLQNQQQQQQQQNNQNSQNSQNSQNNQNININDNDNSNNINNNQQQQNGENQGQENNQQVLLQNEYFLLRRPHKLFVDARQNFQFSASCCFVLNFLKIVYFLILVLSCTMGNVDQQIFIWSIFIVTHAALAMIYYFYLAKMARDRKKMLDLAEKLNKIQYINIGEEKIEQFEKIFPGFKTMSQEEQKSYIDLWEMQQFEQGYVNGDQEDDEVQFGQEFLLDEEQRYQNLFFDQNQQNLNQQQQQQQQQQQNQVNQQNIQNNQQLNQEQDLENNFNQNNDWQQGNENLEYQGDQEGQNQEEGEEQNQENQENQQNQNAFQNLESKNREISLLAQQMKFQLKKTDLICKTVGNIQFLYFFGLQIWGLVMLFDIYNFGNLFKADTGSQLAFQIFLFIIITSHVHQYFDFYLGIIVLALLLPFILIFFVFAGIKQCLKKNKNKSISKKLKAVKFDPNKIPEENRECNICMSDYQQGEYLIYLPCQAKHHFHENCIREWLKVTPNCPLCRQNFSEQDAYQQQQNPEI